MDKFPKHDVVQWEPPTISVSRQNEHVHFRTSFPNDQQLRRDFDQIVKAISIKLKLSAYPAAAFSLINLVVPLLSYRSFNLDPKILTALSFSSFLLLAQQIIRLEHSREKMRSVLPLVKNLHFKVLPQAKPNPDHTKAYQPSTIAFGIEQVALACLLYAEIFYIGFDRNERLFAVSFSLWLVQALVSVISYHRARTDIRTKLAAFFPYIEDSTGVRVDDDHNGENENLTGYSDLDFHKGSNPKKRNQ